MRGRETLCRESIIYEHCFGGVEASESVPPGEPSKFYRVASIVPLAQAATTSLFNGSTHRKQQTDDAATYEMQSVERHCQLDLIHSLATHDV